MGIGIGPSRTLMPARGRQSSGQENRCSPFVPLRCFTSDAERLSVGERSKVRGLRFAGSDMPDGSYGSLSL